MELAGREMAIKLSPTNSTFILINGVDNSTLKRMCDMLDISSYGNDYKKRMSGMKDGNLNLSGNYDPTDTTGQLMLVPGDFVYIQVLPNGTTGVKAKFIVEDFNFSAPTEGKQTFSATVHFCGDAPTPVTP